MVMNLLKVVLQVVFSQQYLKVQAVQLMDRGLLVINLWWLQSLLQFAVHVTKDHLGRLDLKENPVPMERMVQMERMERTGRTPKFCLRL